MGGSEEIKKIATTMATITQNGTLTPTWKLLPL